MFNVPAKAKVIWRRGHSLKSHPTDWWSQEWTCHPWFTKQAVYPLHHKSSSRKKQNFNGVSNVNMQRGSVPDPCTSQICSIGDISGDGNALAPCCDRKSTATQAQCGREGSSCYSKFPPTSWQLTLPLVGQVTLIPSFGHTWCLPKPWYNCSLCWRQLSEILCPGAW